MSVFTVPSTGGPTGPAGAPGASTPAQQYGGIAKTGDLTTVNPTQALALGFNKVLNFNSAMPSSGVTPLVGTSNLIVGTAGDYFVYAYLSWAYSPVGSFRIAVFVNGAVNFAILCGDKTFAFTPSNSCAQNFVTLPAGATLDLRVAPSTASTLTLESAQLYVERANP